MKIFFSVGEPSGDQHAAHLMAELRRRRPDVECVGFGGPLMEQAGLRSVYRLTDLAVMGLWQTVPLLAKFVRLVGEAEQFFAAERPDAVVLVDFPGFNWSIAKRAKAAGIPVFYYLPPQLWAWAAWRVRRMRKWVDRALCGLPFEPEWYAKRGVKADFVGHPFFDEVADYPLDRGFVARWQRPVVKVVKVDGSLRDPKLPVAERPVYRPVGVLPGSRTHEVERNWPLMIRIMRRVAARHPDVRFLVACYKAKFEERCRQMVAEARVELPIDYFVGKTPEIIEAAECCLMVSGSVSLEMLARRTPAAVLYRVSPWAYPAVRILVRLNSFTLPNIIAGRRILPEWLAVWNHERVVGQMADTLDGWLSDPASRTAVAHELEELYAQVGRTGATARTAEAVLGHLAAASVRRAA
ncbi:MAG: lipid-A-disaccharide synthase [Planctomycetes bacterium]|nr:lipid-A-disaccharide synthase [Planctomycetota bacterium]